MTVTTKTAASSEDDDTNIQLPDKSKNLRLRSIRKRMETERNKNLPKQGKTKERPAPLSKYRRKTANARERQRMHQVNVAFEQLKATIPHHKLNIIDEKKDTKITTLRCAIDYINSLSDLLADVKQGRKVGPEFYFTDAQLGLQNDKDERQTTKKKTASNKCHRRKRATVKASRPARKTIKRLKAHHQPLQPNNSSLPPPSVLALARSPLPVLVQPLPVLVMNNFQPNLQQPSSKTTVLIQSDVSLFSTVTTAGDELTDLDTLKIDLNDYTNIQDFIMDTYNLGLADSANNTAAVAQPVS
jgi:hypothetical protein